MLIDRIHAFAKAALAGLLLLGLTGMHAIAQEVKIPEADKARLDIHPTDKVLSWHEDGYVKLVRTYEQRVYDLSRLLEAAAKRGMPRLMQFGEPEGVASISNEEMFGQEGVDQDTKMDHFRELVLNLIDPEGWTDSGGEEIHMAVMDQKLIINADQKTHAHIDELLNAALPQHKVMVNVWLIEAPGEVGQALSRQIMVKDEFLDKEALLELVDRVEKESGQYKLVYQGHSTDYEGRLMPFMMSEMDVEPNVPVEDEEGNVVGRTEALRAIDHWFAVGVKARAMPSGKVELNYTGQWAKFKQPSKKHEVRVMRDFSGVSSIPADHGILQTIQATGAREVGSSKVLILLLYPQSRKAEPVITSKLLKTWKETKDVWIDGGE